MIAARLVCAGPFATLTVAHHNRMIRIDETPRRLHQEGVTHLQIISDSETLNVQINQVKCGGELPELPGDEIKIWRPRQEPTRKLVVTAISGGSPVLRVTLITEKSCAEAY